MRTGVIIVALTVLSAVSAAPATAVESYGNCVTELWTCYFMTDRPANVDCDLQFFECLRASLFGD
jgi:hypothetical protein